MFKDRVFPEVFEPVRKVQVGSKASKYALWISEEEPWAFWRALVEERSGSDPGKV